MDELGKRITESVKAIFKEKGSCNITDLKEHGFTSAELKPYKNKIKCRVCSMKNKAKKAAKFSKVWDSLGYEREDERDKGFITIRVDGMKRPLNIVNQSQFAPTVALIAKHTGSSPNLIASFLKKSFDEAKHPRQSDLTTIIGLQRILNQ